MQKLFVPFDASESAWHALEYAIKLAKEHGQMELHLATVHPEPVMYGEVQLFPREQMEKQQRAYCMEILKPAFHRTKLAGVPFTSETLMGTTAATIVERAEKLNCICIIMGTRGMGAVRNLVLGSVATKVIHLTKLPVTLVK